jgi:hypothetical protein
MVAAQPIATRGFNCGNCGAAVALRALQHARAVVCTSCGAILDPRDPNVFVLQKAAARQSIMPEIPLGTRGTWHGQPWDVVGFQRRSIEVEGVRYSWDEYVLFNPYRGFRYLSTYQGHWNDIRTVRELPATTHRSGTFKYRDEFYKHFQSATARTDYVLGEFPWRVRTGDTVEVSDYVSPPYMLSSEGTEEERTWSLGTYTSPEEIWRAFSLLGSPPRPSGVFANQPSPYQGSARGAFQIFAVLAALVLATMLVRMMTADRERVFSGKYVHEPSTPDSAFVTEPFALRAASTVEITLRAEPRNAWLGLDLALINSDTGTAWNVAREVSFYSGSDSDGPWTEDERTSRLLLPSVPAGQYYLRVEPEGDPGPAVPFTILVRRDVPSYLPYGLALVILCVPMIVRFSRASSFEARRWQESDHAE